MGELLELFMVSAVTALLVNRFILFLLGYPSIGGSKLHIAHMLWGGLLMLIGLILVFVFLGYRVRQLASIVAGAGFGLFIDELGKFITRDNNYFFQPTIALIYLIFVILFIIFRSLSSQRRLSQQEYLMNALSLSEETIMIDLSSIERQQALSYLEKADQSNPLVKALTEALNSTKTVDSDNRAWLKKWADGVVNFYNKLIHLPYAAKVIDGVFIIKALIFPLLLILGPIDSLKNGISGKLDWMTVLELISSLVAGAYVLAGVLKIKKSRLKAYELFSKSLLIDIFITQFFAFYVSQFQTLYVLAINVALYFAVRFLIQQEKRKLVT